MSISAASPSEPMKKRRQPAELMDRKLKVAFLGTRGIPASYSGFETFVEELAVRLVARGWDVTVFNRYPFVPLRGATYRGVKIVRLRTVQRKSLDTLVHTFLSCCCLPFVRPDVVYFCGVGNAIFCLIPKLLGIPSVINVDGEDWARKKWSGFAVRWLKWSEGWACKFADVVIADSRAIQGRYAEVYRRETVFVPYGANIRLEERGTGTLEKFGLRRDGYVLFCGRFVPENRAELLIKVFNTIETDVKLVLVGDAPYADEYKRELQELAGPNVVFTGYAFGDAYAQLSRNCLFYVLASGINGTRPVLLDQMGFGNCVVVRNSASNAEVVADAAITFEDSDEFDSLRAAIVRLLGDRALVEEYRKKAVERVRAAYDWDQITEQYEKLFLELAGSRV
jgi:glycosyltransferase involved in cell wall biosynthesis